MSHIPSCPAFQPGDTVVTDSLTARKVTGLRQAIEAAGAHLLDLPAYSPDFNPIENAFAKLKALPRSAAARTVQDLWAAIREAFTHCKPDECRNDLADAGDDAMTPLERQQLSSANPIGQNRAEQTKHVCDNMPYIKI